MTSATAHADPGKNTPGHIIQRCGSVPGHPGGSGYAPGHITTDIIITGISSRSSLG